MHLAQGIFNNYSFKGLWKSCREYAEKQRGAKKTIQEEI